LSGILINFERCYYFCKIIKILKIKNLLVAALFVWLISHQPAVLFSQNKSAITNQPAVLFSQNKAAPAISHRPNEQAAHGVWSRRRPLSVSPTVARSCPSQQNGRSQLTS
jgi:hypothetical protein